MPVTSIRIPNFDKASKEVRKLYARVLPIKIASEAEQHFKNSFRNQGFTDSQLKPWKRTKSGKRSTFNRSVGVLIQSGNLKRSIRTVQKRDGVIVITAGNQHVPYAKIHNEGGRITRTVTVRQHKRRIVTTSRIRSTSLATRRTTARKQRVVTGFCTVRSHARKMNTAIPKRQFMGESRMLNDTINRVIIREINALERDLFNS
ncbi:MAG TPA: phage virion morphogenesis protein [Bacteroidales bacterium]|nr:phage virion morphogenesis protein [Bacteroidales bacterium]HSA43582.1 phage virion morphogenesis protein [Bacteroidales bacterium]